MKPILVIGGLLGLYVLYKAGGLSTLTPGAPTPRQDVFFPPTTAPMQPAPVTARFAPAGGSREPGAGWSPTVVGSAGGLFFQTPQYLLVETTDKYGNKILVPCPGCGPATPGYSGADLLQQLDASYGGVSADVAAAYAGIFPRGPQRK